MSIVLRVASSASAVTKDYIEALAKLSGLGSITTRVLRRLALDLDLGLIDPFPASELSAYLEERGVPEEDLTKLKKTKPTKKREVDFTGAWTELAKVTGKNIVFQGSLEHNKDAPAAVQAWIAAFKKMKPLARKVFSEVVKKIRLVEPRGSEDASWEHGGVLALTVKKRSANSAVLAGYITHELGHGLEERGRINLHEDPWGLPPFASDYAEMRPNVEDFAEAFRVYVESPSTLRRVAPAKFEAIKRLV